MDLGGIEEFDYVPKFRSNRQQPAEEQVSLKVKRMSAMEVLAEPSDAKLYEWRNTAFRKWAQPEKAPNDQEERVVGFTGIAEALWDVPTNVLHGLRRVIRHTHGYKGFTHNGRTLTEPTEIMLHCRIPNVLEMAGDNLVGEILDVLNATSTMNDKEVEDFILPSDGGTTETQPGVATAAAEGKKRTSAATGRAQAGS